MFRSGLARLILIYNADDIPLIERNVRILEDVFGELERRGRKMGLNVNATKTKYMKESTSQARRTPINLTSTSSRIYKLIINKINKET